AVTQVQRHFFVRPLVGERQFVGALSREKAREVDAVVGRARLLGEGDDLDLAAEHQLDEAMADHSMADHDDAQLRRHIDDYERGWFRRSKSGVKSAINRPWRPWRLWWPWSPRRPWPAGRSRGRRTRRT